jgi:hypothetical protein
MSTAVGVMSAKTRRPPWGRDTDPNNQLTLALEALVKESPQQRAAVVAEGRALVTLYSKLMRDVDLEARLQLLRKEAGARGERSC